MGDILKKSLRPTSIKTRIETKAEEAGKGVYPPLRPTSIKTRIETSNVCKIIRCIYTLRPTSIKTRIETKCSLKFLNLIPVVGKIDLMKKGLHPRLRRG